MQNRMESHIRQSRGYDHYRSMRYDHRFSDVRFKHILLPVWLSSYTYRGKIYRFMVNGETGRVAGKAPVSPLKVLLACLARGGSGGSDRAARVFLRQFMNRARLPGMLHLFTLIEEGPV